MKIRMKLIFLAVCLSFLVTGCSIGGKRENIDQGMAAIENMDYEGALVCFEKALVEAEDAELIYRGRGIAYIGLTQYEDAISALEKSLSYCNGMISSLEFDINYYLALAYYKNGDRDKALGVYNAILDLREDEKTAYYLRGTLRLERGEFEQADSDFQKALELDQTDYDWKRMDIKKRERNTYKKLWRTEKTRYRTMIRAGFTIIWKIMTTQKMLWKRPGIRAVRKRFSFWAELMRRWEISIMHPVSI